MHRGPELAVALQTEYNLRKLKHNGFYSFHYPFKSNKLTVINLSFIRVIYRRMGMDVTYELNV